MGLLAKIFGDPHAREVKKLWRYVEEVNTYEERMRQLQESEFAQLTSRFKGRLEEGETLEDLLPEAFALVREAARRVLGMRPFDVQVLGGVVLHQGRIAEMKTGEGKTLVATMPVYLNALTGKGVHIITVNDYLARRDRDWMGPVYELLGLKVGLIVHDMKPAERRDSYLADVVYGTNNEFGFDYLRDNMVIYKENMVQRPLHYAIVDEVDSILVDEARTPLIISGAAEKAMDYEKYAALVPRLKQDVDYTADEKAQNVELTEEGFTRAEEFLGIENLADEGNMEVNHHLRQALKAHVLMKRDRDYVVKDGQVVIVDEFTGRLMFGRRYSDGLHQAIEAKEKVSVARESVTLASITFQNYFRMYEKLAGMTGTAITEEEEFRKIYGMDVVLVPTNKPMIREDLPDAVYRTKKSKFMAAVEEIERRHRQGQPVLVGTISIEMSEKLSEMLSRWGIPHHVLNAKHHEREAEIVAQAGEKGAVTIATNMAGRGTDIVLGGNVDPLIEAVRAAEDHSEEQKQEKSVQLREEWQKRHDEIVALGGLHILGTERHEARRIDNQLRGRSGRQGDPGSSQFFVSLEDDLLRLFGGDNVSSVMDKLGMDEGVPIEHSMISRAIENAQKKVEGRNFEIRKHLLEYDDVLNKQREVIYAQRRQVLEGENLRQKLLGMIEDAIESSLALYADEKLYEEEWDIEGLLAYGEKIFLPPGRLKVEDFQEFSREEIKEKLLSAAQDYYSQREEELGPEVMRELERRVLLYTVDSKWMDHIDAMHQLRQEVGLRAYGQQDPLVEYKYEGYEMFQEMVRSIQEDVVRRLFNVRVSREPERRSAAEPVKTVKAQGGGAMGEARGEETAPAAGSGSGAGAKKKPVTVQKVGRNAPCPCNSGKKYKKCCGS